MKNIKVGKYRHYKGKYYKVVGVARHSDTLQEFVIYRALYDSREFGKKAWWVKPVSLFTKKIKYKNKRVPRFKYISE